MLRAPRSRAAGVGRERILYDVPASDDRAHTYHDSHRSHPHARRISCRGSTGSSRCRPTRSAASSDRGARQRRAGLHRRRAGTPRAAGPSGRKASSTARRCCSSTPPASATFLELGRERTLTRMAPHLTHVGVHDHGFNNVSTYGALWRHGARGPHRGVASGSGGSTSSRSRSAAPCRRDAGRRCPTAATSIRSTARTRCSSTRSARCARSRSRTSLGHRLVEEQDAQVNLLTRLVQHARATATLQRVLRRTAAARSTSAAAWRTKASSTSPTARIAGPSTQQGYSPFSTWTRGLAWAMLGFAEQLEFLATLTADDAAGRPAQPTRERSAGRRRARHVRLLHRRRPRAPTACPTGTPARPGSSALGDWGSRAVRSVQRSRAGRQLRRRDRRAGAAALRPVPRSGAATTASATRRRACACSTRCSTRRART